MTLPENISQLNIVFLHDWLVSHRGGERLLQGILEPFPKAPIYTLVHKPGSVSTEIEAHPISTSFLQSMPLALKKHRHYLPLMPKAAQLIQLPPDTDIIISSSHCVIKAVPKPNKKVFHACYIHSPMRYLYDQYDSYFGPGSPIINRLGMSVFKNYLTNFDQTTNDNVDLFMSNSQFVKARVKEFYHRDAIVMTSFIDLEDFEGPKPHKKDFYLMVSAFAPNKRIDLAIEAFNDLKLPLKIIGSGQDEERLKSMAGPNIEFLGSRSRAEVVEHFQAARAFVFPGVEDFGLTPLESLAAGTPVIAFNKGGATETLNKDVAEFFDDPTAESLKYAIVKSQNRTFDLQKMKAVANQYSKTEFLKKFYQTISSEYERFKYKH
jgi:glycosyltransferase involved in cell wall biosynthesis